MAYELLVSPTITNTDVKVSEMAIGEIGVITNEGHHEGVVVLRTFEGLVSLNNPYHTWSEETSPRVRVIPGAEVTIKGA